MKEISFPGVGAFKVLVAEGEHKTFSHLWTKSARWVFPYWGHPAGFPAPSAAAAGLMLLVDQTSSQKLSDHIQKSAN